MMKKSNLLIGIMLALSVTVVQAQIDNPLVIGAKAGINFNQFSQPGTTVGGQIGGFVSFSPISLVAVQGELLYDLQGGGRQDYTWDLETLLGTNQSFNSIPVSMIHYSNRGAMIHTLSVPISARIKPVNSTNVKLSFLVGGSFDYAWGAFERRDAIYQFTDDTRLMNSDELENISSDIRDIQASVHVGVAFDFAMDDGNVITYEMRYRKGLRNLNSALTNIAELTEALRTQTISFSVYYPIPLF
jgi:hypothetical protein